MRDGSLKGKIFLLAFLPVIVLSIILCGYFIIQIFINEKAALNERAASQIQQLESAVKYVLITKNQPVLQALTESSVQNQGIRAAAVFGIDGKLLAYSGPDYLMPKDLENYQQLLKKPMQNFNSFLNSLAVPAIHVKEFSNTNVSVANNTKINVGWVGVIISDSTASYIKLKTILMTLIITFLAIIIAGLLIRILLPLIMRPVENIHKIIQSLQEKNYNFKIQRLPEQEFNNIAEGLDKIKTIMQQFEQNQHEHISQEISDLKHTLEKIEVQNIELNGALKNADRDNRKKSEFIASLSHEIRTPMSSIIGFTNLLLESEITKYQQDYLITIQKSANTLLAIINDILDFSKIEAGKFKLTNIPFDFSDVVDDVLQSLAPEAQRKHLELIPFVAADIPKQVIGDPLRLKQILTNLVFNAIKFTETGSVCLKTELINQSGTAIKLQISVIDTGIGLSDKDKKKLFKTFGQADISVARKFGGTGLGLVISKQLIEQMGGNIEIHSKVGIGTTIHFSLNLNALVKPEAVLKQLNKSVLVFDTHLLSRQAIEQCLLLRLKNLITVDTVEWLKLKLAELKNNNSLPDRIILSLSAVESQKTHTLELLQFLKDEYDVSITVLVNTANETIINELISNGAYNCIVKPISLKKLLAALNEVQPSYPTAAAASSLTVEEFSATYSNSKILIVEDNPTNLKLIASLLKSLVIAADTAIDGKLACKACDQKKYSMIFLDLNMPIMGGYQAAENIRKHSLYNKTTPIIAISAYISEDDNQKLYESGFNELLVKPVDIKTLERVINKWNNKVILPATLADQMDPTKDIIPLDLERTIELSAGSKELALEIIQMFMNEIPVLLDKMQTAYINKEWQDLKDAIHKIHGSSRFCAMTKLQNTAAEFEHALAHALVDEYAGLYEKIKTDISELQKYVEIHILENGAFNSEASS